MNVFIKYSSFWQTIFYLQRNKKTYSKKNFLLYNKIEKFLNKDLPLAEKHFFHVPLHTNASLLFHCFDLPPPGQSPAEALPLRQGFALLRGAERCGTQAEASAKLCSAGKRKRAFYLRSKEDQFA